MPPHVAFHDEEGADDRRREDGGTGRRGANLLLDGRAGFPGAEAVARYPCRRALAAATSAGTPRMAITRFRL
jgi:succinylarginine dihydrolase